MWWQVIYQISHAEGNGREVHLPGFDAETQMFAILGDAYVADRAVKTAEEGFRVGAAGWLQQFHRPENLWHVLGR